MDKSSVWFAFHLPPQTVLADRGDVPPKNTSFIVGMVQFCAEGRDGPHVELQVA
jgi:hypothetical protein